MYRAWTSTETHEDAQCTDCTKSPRTLSSTNICLQANHLPFSGLLRVGSWIPAKWLSCRLSLFNMSMCSVWNQVALLYPNPVDFLSKCQTPSICFLLKWRPNTFKSIPSCQEEKKSTHHIPPLSSQDPTVWLSFSQWMPPNKCAVEDLCVHSHS